jgi:EAL domain-containing protein (putative c-di-GMP-specific phosphodiesterase class I)
MAIAHAVVALAHTLQMSVVAEGVETPAQLHYLRRIGCDLVQGHLFSRAVPAEEVLPLLRSAEGRIRVRAATPVT